MTPYYADDWLTVHHGDARAVLAEMEPESVNCVVSSPPYWGLRDYGTATWDGGDVDCDHLNGPLASSSSTLAGYTSENIKLRTNGVPFKGSCGKCGATRIDEQLGLEVTPEAYVAALVAVFREVRRVLRDDGTVWLNLGDSYATGNPSGRRDADRRGEAGAFTDGDWRERQASGGGGFVKPLPYGLKPKDLVGIPWMVAFALRADGWYLRSDIIWAKPNPMPESVTDRPTKSHEYVFLLAKSPRYYFDADAVREPHIEAHLGRYGYDFWPEGTKERNGGGRPGGGSNTGGVKAPNPLGRNIRSVWTVATQPYPGAHFATFPPKLIEPMILAGCPEGGVVLDPFAGSGTTGLVAQRLSRRAVLIDLSMDYLGQIMDRNRDIPLGLGA